MDKGPAIEPQGPSLPPRRFASTQFRRPATPALPGRFGRLFVCLAVAVATVTFAKAQQAPAAHAKDFLAQRVQRTSAQALSPAAALLRARGQHLALLGDRRAHPRSTVDLTVAWQPLGPVSIVSPTYNKLTGRITAVAPDPNDATGNTVYLGTTGGGVWKSTNAAGALGSVTFAPLTDTLPVFSANAGTGVIPSLSIGAVAVQTGLNPIVLAGTGDPNDATDSYYGEGILRSADGGLTWTLIQGSHDGANGNHSFTGLATAGIAFSTVTPTLAVAAFSVSAESAIVDAATSASIPGLYFSTDAGVTWQMATIMDGSQIVQQPQPLGTGEAGNPVTSIVWDALRQQFFAAVRSHGYYSSPDGETWTRLANQPGTALTTANCPVGSNGLGSGNCPIFRGVLASQTVTGDLYAFTVDSDDIDQGLWQDLCNAASNICATAAPTFANRIDNGALDTGPTNATILQGGYDLALSAAPATNNSTLLFAGTVDLYRCELASGATSCSLRNTTNALDGCDAPAQVAAAQHAIATVAPSPGSQASGSPILYLGNDGGLWRSLDGVAETGSVCAVTDKTHFDNLNASLSGSLAEVVGFADDPSAVDTLIAGLGALGSAATSTVSQLAPWPQISAGEGGFPAIDATTPANWTIAIGSGINVAACDLGVLCAAANFDPPATIGETQVSEDAALLDAPTLLDPAQTANIVLGTCRVWRGPAGSGTTWSPANAISPAFDGGAVCISASALIRSLAAGGPGSTSSNAQLSGSEVLYAGLAGALDGGGSLPGHLFVTANANTAPATWADAALSPVTNDTADAQLFNPGQFDISSITVDPHDATGATVYATIMGFGYPHIYRSADFGAHWLNLSANLPDAPANAVAVDPNDANTVYIVLDTGVYVTQAITTCPTTNCWSVLGTVLPNAPVVSLATAANLPTGDGRRGLLRAGTYGRGIWQTPLLTAVSLAQPAIMFSASSFTFGQQQVQTQSAAQRLIISSSGNAPVTFGTPAITGDFTETDDCAGQTVVVGATCSVQIVFVPAAIGARAGQLTIYANISGGQAIVALTGTGTAPASIVLTPLSLGFAATIVNQTTAAQNITISNLGGNSATLQTPILTGADPGDFAITANTCGAMLSPSTGCTVSIVFTPTASGTRSANFSISDNVGTQTATLTGTGNTPATDTLTPTALTFAQQQIGTVSSPQQVTLTNAGDVALTLITASIPANTDFAVTNACGNSLAAHSTCAFSVTFSPTATGARSATLTVSDQFRSQTVLLNGTGIAPAGVSLSPSSLAFPATGVGLTTQPQTLTLTNNGGVALDISGIAASAGFTIATYTCGTTLAAGAACTLSLVFTPSAAGPQAGTLNFTDDAASGTQAAVLTGIGIDFTLSSSGPTSVTLLSTGGSGKYPMLLSSLAGLAGNVAVTCAGVPANTTCNVLPSLAPLGGTSTIAVTVETAASALTASRSSPLGPATLFMALLLPLGFCLRRSRAGSRLLPVAVLSLLASALTACGADRVIPNAIGTPVSGNPTPKGTYTLTVSGASAGLTHSVQVTLVVD